MIKHTLHHTAMACVLGTTLVIGAGPAMAQTARAGLVDDQRLLAANDQTDTNWITFGQDYRNQRYSSLASIDRGNVARLAPAWIYQLWTVGSTQTQPLVVDGVMYVTAPNCDFSAYDTANGAPLWSFQTGANVGSSVVTYSVEGRQYVAVATGAAAPAEGVALAPAALRPGGAVIAFALPK